jgi:hypothetical protein
MAIQRYLSVASNSTDANFRSWGKSLSDALEALGVTKTADTGQIDWSTVLKPSGSPMVMGYEIRQFTDDLQAANPVIIKFEYGASTSGSGGPCPGIKITVGSASDGAGALTGSTSSVFSLFSTASDAVVFYPSYVSSDGGRVNLALWISETATLPLAFWIERLKDTNGAPIADGVNICYIGSATYSKQQFLPAGGGSAFPPAPLNSFCCCFPPSTPTTYNENIGIFPVYPHLGYSGNPDLGGLVYLPAELDCGGAVMTINLYGTNHSYILMGAMGQVYVNGRGYASVMVRCE